jgi:hypothetical protein
MNEYNKYVEEYETIDNKIITLNQKEIDWCDNISWKASGNNVYYDCGQENRLLISEQMYVGKKSEVAFYKWKKRPLCDVQGLLKSNKWETDYKQGELKITIKSKSKITERKYGTSFIIQNGIYRKDLELLNPDEYTYVALITEGTDLKTGNAHKYNMVLRALFPAKLLIKYNLFRNGIKKDKSIIYMREIIDSLGTNNLFIKY